VWLHKEAVLHFGEEVLQVISLANYLLSKLRGLFDSVLKKD
jgi:hypothetical protein